MTHVADAWNRFWFRPASPLGPIAVRALLAGNALWIVLSRPTLPNLTSWPDEMWRDAMPYRALRFLIVPGQPAIEQLLFALLHVALLAALVGVVPRAACAVSGVLLYHFAPFEEVLAHPQGPALRGLTFPLLGLLALSFAPAPRLRDDWSPDFRWPVALAQALFCFQYVAPAIAKLKVAGFAWALPETVSRSIVWTASTFAEPLPWARTVATSAFLCGVIAVTTLVTEVLFPLVLVSSRAAAVLVPIVAVGHVGVAKTLGVVFLNFPMLLMYIDWDALARRLESRRRQKL